MRQRSERWGGDYYHASAAAGATPVSFASVPTETMRLVAMAAYQAGGHCSTIANYAIPSTVDYKTIRESFVEDAFTSATLVIIGAYVKKVMLAGSIASVNFRVRTAERLYSRTRMHILAADWNSYNCHNRYVEAGPMWVTAAVAADLRSVR